MKIGYLDLFAGISGDMILGALIAVGVDSDRLKLELKKLNLDDFELDFELASRHGITGTRAIVKSNEKDQVHRHYGDIVKIIDESDLSSKVTHRAKEVFDRIATVEAKIHGVPKEKIHLHEVSGIDSIVDVVGAMIGFELLELDRIFASTVTIGRGFVKCSHGNMPVPAPATIELLRGIPLRQLELGNELTTPTGAAIVSTLVSEFGAMPEMKVDSIGYGVATRELKEIPNLLRICVGEMKAIEKEKVEIIETNIDDMSPELVAHVMERLFEADALDVFLTPIVMKKGRSAVKLSVICNGHRRDNLIEIILRETTTFGLRYYEVNRETIERDFVELETKRGKVRAKRGSWNGEVLKIVPEFEECKRIAEQSQLSIGEVFEMAIGAKLDGEI